MADGIEVGDEVIVMSAAGRFTVVAIDGPVLTIQNTAGLRKTVLDVAVRKVEKQPATR